ncbi:MAG: hypothetical protein FJ387_23810 [Verrucomicrobia bacterium]|nr:hypothetical protein [Verrucomicrobiota bacterium]
MQSLLERILEELPADRSWRKDLLQEGLVYLWRMETRRPGQTASWYLQSCRYRLERLLREGCSLDAPRRSSKRVDLPENHTEAWDDLLDPSSESVVVAEEPKERKMQLTV